MDCHAAALLTGVAFLLFFAISLTRPIRPKPITYMNQTNSILLQFTGQ
jgi:hypothetical protein